MGGGGEGGVGASGTSTPRHERYKSSTTVELWDETSQGSSWRPVQKEKERPHPLPSTGSTGRERGCVLGVWVDGPSNFLFFYVVAVSILCPTAPAMHVRLSRFVPGPGAPRGGARGG